jgi:hypothetical protein
MNVLTIENVLLIVGSLIVFLMLVAFSMVLHANWDRVVYILTPLLSSLRHDYVQRSQAVREVNQNARVPDTDAIVPVSVPPRTSSTEPVPNRETLIRIAALTVNEDGSYTYSANKIAEFIGGARGATLEAIRAARGTPEPTANDPYQFEKTGPRETYQRTGVKPLRG